MLRMRVISAILIFYGAILLPFKNCPMNIIRLIEFELKQKLQAFKSCACA